MFNKKPSKSGAAAGDDRCPECGGIAGRHNQVRVSKRTNPAGNAHGQYKIVYEDCPRNPRGKK